MEGVTEIVICEKCEEREFEILNFDGWIGFFGLGFQLVQFYFIL